MLNTADRASERFALSRCRKVSIWFVILTMLAMYNLPLTRQFGSLGSAAVFSDCGLIRCRSNLKCHGLKAAVWNAVQTLIDFHPTADRLAASIKEIEVKFVQKPTKREMLHSRTGPTFQSFPYKQSGSFRLS